MYLDGFLTTQEKTTLSRCGLNRNYINYLMRSNRLKYKDLLDILFDVRNRIAENEPDIIYDICENRIFKKHVLFRNIYPYVTNYRPYKMIEHLQDLNKRNALLDRLDMIIFTLIKH